MHRITYIDGITLTVIAGEPAASACFNTHDVSRLRITLSIERRHRYDVNRAWNR